MEPNAQAEARLLDKGRRTIANATIETMQLVKELRKVQEDETIAYHTLSDTIGMDVQAPKGRGYLHSARRILEREGFFFSPMIGDSLPYRGLRRVTHEEQVMSMGKQMIRRNRRSAALTAKRCVYVDYDKLSPEAKREWNVTMTYSRLISQFTKTDTVAKIDAAIGNSGKSLDLTRTLEMFLPKTGI